MLFIWIFGSRYSVLVDDKDLMLTNSTFRNKQLRAVVSNYRESVDSCTNLNFFSFTKKSLWVNYFQKQYSKVPVSLRFGEK